jgi:pimeloyl-ACP methyl ester carboxylesterase
VETNGITLHYLDYPGDGPTLVLTHGLTANAFFFGRLAEELAPLRVLALDLRGRGLSDKPISGYSMADHAADILGAMDALGLDAVIKGGHSFGGLLTYYMAAEFPERVNKAVVIDAPAEVDTGILEQIKPSLERLETVLESRDAYVAMAQAMPYYEGWDWDPDLEHFYRSDVEDLPDGSVRSRCRPDNIMEAVQGTLDIDLPEIVSRIQQPLLLARAIEPLGPAPILPADKAARTLDLLADGRLIELHGNHMTALFAESARELATAMVAFATE